jgi:hypothetical protein
LQFAFSCSLQVHLKSRIRLTSFYIKEIQIPQITGVLALAE